MSTTPTPEPLPTEPDPEPEPAPDDNPDVSEPVEYTDGRSVGNVEVTITDTDEAVPIG
jgi:hypothetical protein